MSDHDKMRIYEMYDSGEIEEERARVFIGGDLDRMKDDISEFECVGEEDTSKHLVE